MDCPTMLNSWVLNDSCFEWFSSIVCALKTGSAKQGVHDSYIPRNCEGYPSHQSPCSSECRVVLRTAYNLFRLPEILEPLDSVDLAV